MAIRLINCALINNREKFLYEKFCSPVNVFLLVKSGSFSLTTPDGTYTVGMNEGALFRKDIHYLRTVIDPVTIFMFRFHSDISAFPVDYVQFSDILRIKSTIALLDKTFPILTQDALFYQKHLFEDIINQYALEHWNNFPALLKDDAIVEAAINHMILNLYKHITIEQLAEYANLSYVQFLRRFQSACGLSPSDYLAKLRLQKAKQLLEVDDAHIKDIADSCGFANEYYFSNFFRKHTGMSPSAYRNITLHDTY